MKRALQPAAHLGHRWELYALWTWIPAFIAASAAAGYTGGTISGATIDVLAFGAITTRGLGCVWGRWVADQIVSERLVNLSMAASGVCALIIGFAFGQTLWVLAPIAWIGGFFVVADSSQSSALVTAVAPAHAVGTALTLQTSAGFLLTIVTIQLIPVIVEITGWA